MLTAEQIDDIFNRLYPLTQVSGEQKAVHIAQIEEMKTTSGFPHLPQKMRLPEMSARLIPNLRKRRGETLFVHSAVASWY